MIPAGHEGYCGTFPYVHQSAMPSYSRSARSERCRAAHDLLEASDIELLTICSKRAMSSCSRSARSEQCRAAHPQLYSTRDVSILEHRAQ